MTTAGSDQDTRSGGTFWEVRKDYARRTTSHWKRRNKSHQMWTMDLDISRGWVKTQRIRKSSWRNCSTMHANQDSEHFQRERSEARILFSKKGFWVDLPNQWIQSGANFWSVQNVFFAMQRSAKVVLILDTKNFFWDTENFFCDTRGFFRDTKVFCWSKSKNITKITQVQKIEEDKEIEKKQHIFLIFQDFFEFLFWEGEETDFFSIFLFFFQLILGIFVFVFQVFSFFRWFFEFLSFFAGWKGFQKNWILILEKKRKVFSHFIHFLLFFWFFHPCFEICWISAQCLFIYNIWFGDFVFLHSLRRTPPCAPLPLPDTLPRRPFRRRPLRRRPLRPTAQNFALFFPSPATIFILSSSLWGFEAPGPSNVHVWALGLSCETPAALAKCQEQFYNWFAPPPQTSEKVNNHLSQILLASRKKSLEHNRNSTGRRLPTFGTHTSWPSLFWVVVCAVVLLLILLLVAVFLLLVFLLRLAAAATFAAACGCFCCLCSCCCFFLLLLLLLLLLGRRPSNPPSAMFDLQKSQEQFYNWLEPFDLNQLWQNLLVSHRNSTGTRSSPALSPTLRSPTPNFSWFGPPHSGLLAAVVVWKTHTCRFWPSKMFVLFFLLFVMLLSVLAVVLLFFVMFLPFLLLDAGFSCCVLFFPLFVLLLLPLFAVHCCLWCCFCCCCFLLLLLLSGRRPLKNQSLPAFDLPKCLYCFCCCLCCCFSLCCRFCCCCCCGCFLGRRQLNPTLAAFDLPKCQE